MMRVGTHTSGHDTMQIIISEQSTSIYLNVFSPISVYVSQFFAKSILNFMDGSGTQENSTFWPSNGNEKM